MTYTIVVQARDGRWLFGPSDREKELSSRETGLYQTAADASQAAAVHEEYSAVAA